MQAVILAGGCGERLRPLTDSIAKPMVPVAGKPILERVLDSLPSAVDEIIIVIGYKGDGIKSYFGNKRNGILIYYIEQGEQKGTFHALKQAKGIVHDSFLVLNGDSLYMQNDLERLVSGPYAVLARKEFGPSEQYGVCIVENNRLVDIYEKKSGVPYIFANCGAYKISPDIFKEKIIYGPTGEEWLSAMVGLFAKTHPVSLIETSCYYTFTNPEDILRYESANKNI